MINESGRDAAQAIDTLVSRKNGGILAAWEDEMLKRFFAGVRYPDAHSAGVAPQPKLDTVQTAWTIKFHLIGAKSILLRLRRRWRRG